MKRFWIQYVFVILIGSIFGGCQEENDNKLTIVAASNMQFAIIEIIEGFTLETGIGCDLILSSSGKLNAQIKEGAPYDVFVSADMNYPLDVFESGFAIAPPVKYAKGTLILWSANQNLIPSPRMLQSPDIIHIALANPKTAPYGKASIQFLESIDVLNEIRSKLVFGEGINQTNQYIISESVELGITSKSVVLSQQMKDKGNWIELNPDLYNPIEQGMVILKNGKIDLAHQFGQYLLSESAQSVLLKYGYKSPV
jgi:molybdate transport system substrate-binding protein